MHIESDVGMPSVIVVVSFIYTYIHVDIVISYWLSCCSRFGHKVELVDSLNRLSVLNSND